MQTLEHRIGSWREWRHQHVSDLARPYGWTSLVAQYWLRENDTDVTFELLPGTWSVSDGKILYTPDASDRNLSVNSAYPTETVEIPPGRNQTYGHFASVPVYFGDAEVETIVRTTNSGDQIFGVRVRDPLTSRSMHDLGITEFAYDPAWRIPATFTPKEKVEHEQETVEVGVRETTPRIGTLTFEHEGNTYSLELIGKPTARGVQPVAHIRDRTSGPITYGAGRVIELEFSDEAGTQIDAIDFNYAVALPCAVTNYVTCPVPPQENHLDFEVLAGEKKPHTEVERVLTFNAS